MQLRKDIWWQAWSHADGATGDQHIFFNANWVGPSCGTMLKAFNSGLQNILCDLILNILKTISKANKFLF